MMIKFEKGVNDWKVAEFIWKNDGIMNEFDNETFSIFIDIDQPRLRFKDGNTISFENGKFQIL